MVKRKKTEDILMNTDADDISMLAEIQTDTDDLSAIEFEKEIPIMPLRNMVMFPSVVMPVTIGRPSTLKLVNAAYKKKQAIAVVCQVQGDLDDPGFADLYHVGVIAKILRIFEMPGGNTTVIMQSNGPKIHLDNITKTIPYLKGTVTAINENNEEQDSDEFKALTDTCKDLTAKFIDVSEKLSPDTVFAIKNLDNPEILVNFISSNFPFTVEEKIELTKDDVDILKIAHHGSNTSSSLSFLNKIGFDISNPNKIAICMNGYLNQFSFPHSNTVYNIQTKLYITSYSKTICIRKNKLLSKYNIINSW